MQNHLRVSNCCEWPCQQTPLEVGYTQEQLIISSSTSIKVCNRLHDVTRPNDHAKPSILSKTHSDETGNQLLLTNQECQVFKCCLLFCYQFDRLHKYDNDKAPSIQLDATSMTLGHGNAPKPILLMKSPNELHSMPAKFGNKTTWKIISTNLKSLRTSKTSCPPKKRTFLCFPGNPFFLFLRFFPPGHWAIQLKPT